MAVSFCEVNMNKYQRRREGIKRARRVLRVLRTLSIFRKDFYAEGGEYEKTLIKTRVPCSCPMCGNPRKHFGEQTRQERKITIDENIYSW
jgi:hypothetical protein